MKIKVTKSSILQEILNCKKCGVKANTGVMDLCKNHTMGEVFPSDVCDHNYNLVVGCEVCSPGTEEPFFLYGKPATKASMLKYEKQMGIGTLKKLSSIQGLINILLSVVIIGYLLTH